MKSSLPQVQFRQIETWDSGGLTVAVAISG